MVCNVGININDYLCRGEGQSPAKSLLPGYRPLATSSLQRGAGLHHAYTDTALSSKSPSMYDEGYTSRLTDSLRSDDGKHERSGSRDSRDSGDYQYLSGGRTASLLEGGWKCSH